LECVLPWWCGLLDGDVGDVAGQAEVPEGVTRRFTTASWSPVVAGVIRASRYVQRMADFVVILNGGGDFSFEGNSTWKVVASGVLHVWDEPNRKDVWFGPSGWNRVEQARTEPSRWEGDRGL